MKTIPIYINVEDTLDTPSEISMEIRDLLLKALEKFKSRSEREKKLQDSLLVES